jgi:ferredoxin
MRIVLDEDLCRGFGNCMLAAPDVFDLPADSTLVTILQEQPPEALRAAVEEAVQSCPVEALILEED